MMALFKDKDMRMKTIITILDSITETSMPFNEFVIYRATHFKDERHVVLVCSDKENELPEIFIPETVTISRIGINLFKIRKAIQHAIYETEQLKTPYVIHLHQVQSALRAQIAMLGMGVRKNIIFTVHNTFSGYTLHNKVFSFLNATFAYHVSCVSNSSYKAYPHLLKAIKGARITAIPNGVDLERIDHVLKDVESKNSEVGERVFIFVARMVPVKNHMFLLKVIKEVKHKAKYVFIGAEDPKGKIRKSIQEWGLDDNVKLVGLIPRKEVFHQLVHADVYISPSRLEGLPISVLEALYCGIPAILSDIEPHKEVTAEEEFARILPLKHEQWVAAIENFISMPIHRIREMGDSGKSYVENNFSLEKMHLSYSEQYAEILKVNKI